jgi:ferredoxin-like protein FixX
MRTEGTFIAVEVDDAVAGDAAVAARLAGVCPVDVFADQGGRVALRAGHVDECILCDLCAAVVPGAVRVQRLYDLP